MGKLRIFIAEDDRDINELLCDHLTFKGFQVESVFDGEVAKEKILIEEYDLYLLDWMLPNITGLELCKLIRSKAHLKKKPILFLTAKADEESIIGGLESGANDYIKKPFNLNELTARIKVNLREVNKQLKHKDLVVDLTSYSVNIKDKSIKLTKSEFILLKSLLLNKNSVLSREDLVKLIQGDDTIVTNRTVDTHMTGLRKKIDKYSDNIITIRGVGYKFEI